MAAIHQKAIITGSTGGLGSSFAEHFASEGCDLLLLCKYGDRLDIQAQKLRETYPITVDVMACDLADKDRLTDVIKEIGKLENIDHLVNCAGYSENKHFCDESIDAALQMIDVHVCATVRIVHAVLPKMIQRRTGTIITVSSLAAYLPAPGSSIYSATKAFLNAFMESLHMEVFDYGIKVQSLCPGLTRTEFHAGKQDTVDAPCIDLWMEAKDVVRHSIGDLEKGHVISIPGYANRSVRRTVPVLPRRFYYKIAEKIAKKV